MTEHHCQLAVRLSHIQQFRKDKNLTRLPTAAVQQTANKQQTGLLSNKAKVTRFSS